MSASEKPFLPSGVSFFLYFQTHQWLRQVKSFENKRKRKIYARGKKWLSVAKRKGKIVYLSIFPFLFYRYARFSLSLFYYQQRWGGYNSNKKEREKQKRKHKIENALWLVLPLHLFGFSYVRRGKPRRAFLWFVFSIFHGAHEFLFSQQLFSFRFACPHLP